MPARALLLLAALGLQAWGAGSALASGAPDTLTFSSLPKATQVRPPTSFLARHRTPILITGSVLTISSLLASEAFLRAADRRYDLYRASADVSDLEVYYQAARTRDRWSNALLVFGELAAAATLVVAWHDPQRGSEVNLSVLPLNSGAGLCLSWKGP